MSQNNSIFNYNLLNYYIYNELNLNTFANYFSRINININNNNNNNKLFFKNDLLPVESFLFLKKSSFINFFINNMIDTPSCFKKIKSIKRKSFELPLLKFINFLMKNGKKEQFCKYFFKTLNFFYNSSNIKPISNHKKKNNCYLNIKNNINFFKKFNYK
jgi:hypothetical protein